MVGDSVAITTATFSVTITGTVTCQGITENGRGFVELTLPDADPQQRRQLEWSKEYQYNLYIKGQLLYSSPQLALKGTRRTHEGALVLTGSPA
ncbi:hypothetical protein OTB20_25310 [Streptomyces sp. H27-H1]|uniref:hypothetical protein n=1 Tax=unclassified Streptomyces TaxID=2593676 RepID=UPI0022716F25|nr:MULTISPECIES: hypothetical protein [unclassified Streptomyces]MCY0929458.1 hypothetical protein [Streptomyces sp. H27-H1]MCY0938326.1 hypothetical protein [Streptomyces sp. H34-S4]